MEPLVLFEVCSEETTISILEGELSYRRGGEGRRKEERRRGGEVREERKGERWTDRSKEKTKRGQKYEVEHINWNLNEKPT